MRIGKYTSRRTQSLKTGGALIPPALKQAAKSVQHAVSAAPDMLAQTPPHIEDFVDPIQQDMHDNAKQALSEAHKAIYHPAAGHDPQDIVDVASKHIGTAPHFAHQLLDKFVHDIPKHYDYAPTPLTTRFADRKANYLAHAVKVRHDFSTDEQPKSHHGRVAGALDFKQVFSSTKTLAEGFNPADSAGRAMDSFNKINLHNTTARGIAKNALHGYAGNLRAHAAYSQMTGLALTPAIAMGSAVPMAGLYGAAQGFRGAADGVDAVNRRI